MPHPTTRVRTILELLQAYPRLNGIQLATLEKTPQGIRFHTEIADLNWLARLLVTLDCTLVVQRPPALKPLFTN